MNPDNKSDARSSFSGNCQAPDITLPELVGRIYESAPAEERCRILEYLLKPVGALALVGLCNGLFTKIWFRSGWRDLRIQPEDAQTVQSVDVISLVDFVQQSSSGTIDGLAALLSTSPTIVCSATAAILVATLVRRTRAHRT